MSAATSAAEAEAAKIGGWIEGVLLKRLADDKLVLPTIPSVALKCAKLLRVAETNVKTIAAVIETDAVLTARVFRAAAINGVSTSTPGSNDLNLVETLTALGDKELRKLLMDATAQLSASEKVYVSKDPQIAASLRRIWEHAVMVSILARDLAMLAGARSSETAALGGLLHDIGKPVVAAMLLEAERQLIEVQLQKKFVDAQVWISVVNRLNRKVGLALAERWQLPPAVIRCVSDCSEFDNADRASHLNPIVLANALAKKSGMVAGPVDSDDVNALLMIGKSMLGFSDDTLTKLSADVKKRVAPLFD